MDLSALQPAFQIPRRLSAESAWVEHIPFAFVLVSLFRPRAVVELGVHMGDSFCSLCQAAGAEGLDAACTGIDTWRGDEQAGTIGADVLPGLRAHCRALYPFARLVQSTFDDARGSFADGSVDLLHIDGLHAYEAVRHDFETWLPKLSPRGVVLLHDTQVTQPGFGVQRLWKEVAPRHRSFEFFHGYGLGVLAVGPEIGGGLGRFFEWSRTQPGLAREFFAGVGGRLLLARTAALCEDRPKGAARGAGGGLAQAVADWLGAPDLKGRADALLHAAGRGRGRGLRRLFRPRRG